MHFILFYRKSIAILVLLLLLPALRLATAEAQHAPSAGKHAAWNQGWTPLFDGTTTSGWKRYRSDEPIVGWKAIDGTLSRTQNGAGDIITTAQYDNFELEFEYRIAAGGNSGVMFHVSESLPAPWMSGPEIQILDNQQAHDPQHSGWLYGLYKPSKPRWVAKAEAESGLPSPRIPDATRPVGAWNHVYLRVTPHQGEVLLNGVRYYRFQKGTPEWDQRVKASKFAAYDTFGTFAKGHICLQDHGGPVAFRNLRIRPLKPNGTETLPQATPLPIVAVPAFPQLIFPEEDLASAEGKAVSIRPVAMIDDGKNHFITALQRGNIYQIDKSDSAPTATRLVDLTEQVADFHNGNEEGLLGLALHPDFATNRQLFVYYTASNPPRRSVISRLTVPPADRQRAKHDYQEQIILEIAQPFANHNGGSMTFGPDGYLYIGLGDGGSQNDPLGNGQNLQTLLGSILRIDVDRPATSRPYGIPADNPFTDRPDARPEIYAYGFRNVWQLSFDTKTGDLWAADVGQDRYEEIDRITRGGNYGWSLREGSLPFKNPLHSASSTPPGLIDPVWQYDRHQGRSITGGFVYRGRVLPQIWGHYLYADYVSGKIWAIDCDASLTDSPPPQPLQGGGLPVIAFAADDAGQVYFLTEGPPERAFYRLAPSSQK